MEARGLILEARGLILEARELILEAQGAIFKISGIIVILGGAPARKGIPILSQILTHFQLFAVLFFGLFRVHVFSIFCDFGCPEVPFWLPFSLYFESPGPLEKQLKLCNSHRF